MNRQIINRRYRIERKIGEGATSEVFQGFDIVLNRRVAVKTLRLHAAANRAYRLRFEREAQNAARLAHPNIIAIFDVGEDHGLPYIVMEYVDGQTLREIINAEGPFHPDDVAILIEQVAAGLDFAHRNGLVHRDVKPRNILVDRHGLAKISDFGIARGLTDSTLTETGSAAGTVHYISPEQASGLMATPESDIYSLGVLAYEMLTGQLPFDSGTPATIAVAHLNEPPPDPSQINPNVPPEVADIVLQALEKNPTRRYPSAGTFARTLTDWRLYEPIPRLAARMAPPPQSRQETSTDVFETVPSVMQATGRAAFDRGNAFEFEEEERHGNGKTWIAGLIAIAIIAVLLWYGLDLGDRLGGGDKPTVTATSPAIASTATAPAPTSTPLTTAVPNVVGLSQADAERTLTDAGFQVAIGEPAGDGSQAGLVAEQQPAAGAEGRRGDTVTIRIGGSVAAINLAALNAPGRSSDAVVNELTSVGLNVEIRNEGSATVSDGMVVRIEPADSAMPGDTVTVVVSKGNTVQIPSDLQGQPLATARTTLTGHGFTVANEIGVPRSVIANAGIDLDESGIVDGDVVGIQDNGATFGAWLPRGSSVTLVYYDADLPDPAS